MSIAVKQIFSEREPLASHVVSGRDFEKQVKASEELQIEKDSAGLERHGERSGRVPKESRASPHSQLREIRPAPKATDSPP